MTLQDLNTKLHRPEDFLIQDGLIHLNTGSYGVVPKLVRDRRVEWLNKIESHPDLYVSDTLTHLVAEALAPLADYIGAKAENVVFVENTTVGVATILESIGLQKGDVILSSSITYKGIKHTLRKLKETIGIEVVEAVFNAGTDDEIFASFESTIKQIESEGKKVKIAIIDAISSLPAIILPYERISKLVQEHGGLVIVDAAHAFGQIKLDVERLQPDFLITNIHKWGYGFRGQALLYVKPHIQSSIENLVATYGYKAKTLREKFEWSGPVDFSKWFSSTSVLEYRKNVGDDQIYEYNHKLAILGGAKVAEILGTKLLGTESQTAFMANILLPIEGDASATLVSQLEQHILKKYNIRLRIFIFNNQYYTRLSAQLFLNYGHFVKAGEVLKETLDNDLNKLKYYQQKL